MAPPPSQVDTMVWSTPDHVSPLMQKLVDAARSAPSPIPQAEILTRGNLVSSSPLVGPGAVLSAEQKLIANARSEVLIQTMAWRRGSDESAQGGPTNEVLAALQQLQQNRRGNEGPPVRVVVMVDHPTPENLTPVTSFLHQGGKDFDPTLSRSNLKGATEDVASLHLDPKLVQVQVVGYRHLAIGMQHVKTVIADNSQAVVTGMNLQPNFDPKDLSWFDAGTLVTGPAVQGLRDQFQEALGHCTSNPTLPQMPAPPEQPLGAPILLAAKTSQDNLLGGKPSSLSQACGALFQNAQHNIDVITPNFNSEVEEKGALDAMSRGVHLNMVIGKGFNQKAEDLPGQGGDNEKALKHLRQQMADHHIDPSLLQVRWYSADGRAPVVGNGVGASHCKYISADGQVSAMRTANDDTQSLLHSREVIAFVDSQAVAHSYDQNLFGQVWNRAIPAS